MRPLCGIWLLTLLKFLKCHGLYSAIKLGKRINVNTERSLTLFKMMYFKLLSTLKNAQLESCELSFIWGKMRTAARKTASQIALRNCSKEVGGKVSIYVILVKEEYIQSSTLFFLQKISASHEEQSSP